MPYKEKAIEKVYFTIGEVADMLNVATSLIRFWESEFDTIKPKKNKKGNRQFTKDDIENIKLVYHLVKEKGYTLQGAKDMLKGNGQTTQDKFTMINSLQEIKAFLIEVRKQIDS